MSEDCLDGRTYYQGIELVLHLATLLMTEISVRKPARQVHEEVEEFTDNRKPSLRVILVSCGRNGGLQSVSIA